MQRTRLHRSLALPFDEYGGKWIVDVAEDKDTVKSFKSEMEAHLARSKLAASGIKATVHRFSRYRALASGGYLLKVRPDQAARARAILKRFDSDVDMDEYVSSDDETYERCPKCQSVNIHAEPLPPRQWWLSMLLLGIPLLLVKRDWKCDKCSHTWRK